MVKITKEDIERWKNVLEEAKTKPSLMRTKDYVQARYFKPDLHSLFMEMGPNCNLGCFHCASDCGPEKEGLPDSESIEKALSTAKDAGVYKVVLTDGEPIREENTEVLKSIGKFSDQFKVSVITNCVFASTKERAVDLLELMKQEGIDFQENEHKLVVSFGKPYEVPLQNYQNFNDAITEVYPQREPGKFLDYRLINTGDTKDGDKRIRDVMKTLSDSFGKRKEPEITDPPERFRVLFYPQKGEPINIWEQVCYSIGKLSGCELFPNMYPLKELTPDDLMIGNEGDISFLGHDGKVTTFAGYGKSLTENFYGNVNDEPLEQIFEEIREEPFFQGYKIGGIPFLYHLAQEVCKDFRVVGTSRMNVLESIMNNREVLSSIREQLQNLDDVVNEYMDYINSFDLRKRPYC